MRRKQKFMSLVARLYVYSLLLAGGINLLWTSAQWGEFDVLRFVTYLVIATLAGGMKVQLPGVTGTMSVNFLFVLIGVLQLSIAETTVIAIFGTTVQSFWRAQERPRWIQVSFNLAAMVLATTVSFIVYELARSDDASIVAAFPLVIAASAFFVANTAPVAVIIGLTEHRKVVQVWRDCYLWSFSYYIVGAALAAAMTILAHFANWETSLIILPMFYLIYRSYRLYLGRLESETEHAAQMASLHLRTIEALALAIEAKDETTHDHLQRVRVYALEIGQELGLNHDQIEALRAAALLHDIGKLAVPEHIISKPGKLTPEEFEKVKIHPVVGAEILERVQFPYPVAPIVRSHHEKWDGSGYPDGLSGEDIPIGARILSAVDCLDALATDRQYRRAMPLDDALQVVVDGAGQAFDPRVVEILKRRSVELEEKARAGQLANDGLRLSTDVVVERGAAPDAGFEQEAPTEEPETIETEAVDFLSSIASARQEVQGLYELSQALGSSLSIEETLMVFTSRLRPLIPHNGSAVYILRDEKMIPVHTAGVDQGLFASLQIPLGEGLAGWVAANAKPMMNGNPSVEPGYLNDPTKFSVLRSALAVPLSGPDGVIGVLTLYHKDSDAFSQDHLRILLAVAPKVALSVQNAMRFHQASESATIDYLTELPNARSLFVELERCIQAAREEEHEVSLVVCDLDGFKQVNDRYGHLRGNHVLQRVASALRETCRSSDYVARMGGDEFVVIMPNVSGGTIEQRLTELREAVSFECEDVHISMSAGVACFPNDGENAEQLLAEADLRMYQDKKARKAATGGPVPIVAAS